MTDLAPLPPTVRRGRAPLMTPTEHLVLEVLAARTRLEEPFWTFPRRLRPVLRSLEDKGLISFEAAVTPHLRAELTDAGRAEALMPGYRSRWERLTWHHHDGTPCEHGWRHESGECYAGLGLVAPRLSDD